MYTFVSYTVGEKYIRSIHSTPLFTYVWCFVCRKAAIINLAEREHSAFNNTVLGIHHLALKMSYKIHIRNCLHRGKKTVMLCNASTVLRNITERCHVLCLFSHLFLVSGGVFQGYIDFISGCG